MNIPELLISRLLILDSRFLILDSRFSRLETRTSRPSRRENRVSRIESRLSTYLWAVLYIVKGTNTQNNGCFWRLPCHNLFQSHKLASGTLNFCQSKPKFFLKAGLKLSTRGVLSVQLTEMTWLHHKLSTRGSVHPKMDFPNIKVIFLDWWKQHLSQTRWSNPEI